MTNSPICFAPARGRTWASGTCRQPDPCARGISRYWLIDHGAALPFQHDWAAVTEATPRRNAPAPPHVFDPLATHLAEWDPLLTALVTRETMAGAVAEIPDSFLGPLLPPPATAAAADRRRQAYAAFLWKRLQGARPFATSRHDPQEPL